MQDTHVPVSDDTAIDAAILGSLDDLLRSLEMECVATDRYRVRSDVTQMFDRVYGGQLLAQALIGAGMSVDDKAAHSLHAAFVRGGIPGRPVEIFVNRVRD